MSDRNMEHGKKIHDFAHQQLLDLLLGLVGRLEERSLGLVAQLSDRPNLEPEQDAHGTLLGEVLHR